MTLPDLIGKREATPGPWRIEGRCSIRSGASDWIGTVYWRNRDANARLIAAAPDLLAALTTISEWPITHPDNMDAVNMANIARAALAKASAS